MFEDPGVKAEIGSKQVSTSNDEEDVMSKYRVSRLGSRLRHSVQELESRKLMVQLIGLVTLGSGLVNLYSLIGPPLPERMEVVREIFPLEFIHISRLLTLVAGFTLVVSSFNILKRKKRAFQLALFMAFTSVVFHITKGLDYGEAAFSLVLAALLLINWDSFTVRSSTPSIRVGMFRLAIGLGVAFAYGVAGFWFLDPRDFGLNFNLGASIYRTLRFLALVGDPGVIPHTRYAQNFLDSLGWITVLAVGYSAYSLFRPAIYQFRTLPRERALATAIIAKHSRSSQDFFKTWPDKSFLFSPDHDAFLAYGVGANVAVVLGDPVGPEEKFEALVETFMEICRENDWNVAFYQTLPDFLPLYQRLGFRKLKIGDDAVVDLRQFSMEGRGMRSFRGKVRQMEAAGIQAQEYDPPISDDLLDQLKEVSDEWLQIPGRRERSFTLGQFDFDYLRSTRVFVVSEPSGRVLAFVNMVPTHGTPETSADLMRRRTDAPNGIMDYLFVKLFQAEKERGFERFNMGMAPMSGFREREAATLEERAVHFFFQRLNFLFSYQGLRHYKGKFATVWEPRYVLHRNARDLPKLVMAVSKLSEL